MSQRHPTTRKTLFVGAFAILSGYAAFCFAQPSVPPEAIHAKGLNGVPQRVLREIDDPSTGMRWILVHNPMIPTGPGRLLAIGAGNPTSLQAKGGTAAAGGAPTSRPSLPIVIRGGDAVTVEEASAFVELRMEGVALGPAKLGNTLQVRLTVGKHVVSAVALGLGRTRLAGYSPVQP
jgi:hypothetical protein